MGIRQWQAVVQCHDTLGLQRGGHTTGEACISPCGVHACVCMAWNGCMRRLLMISPELLQLVRQSRCGGKPKLQ